MSDSSGSGWVLRDKEEKTDGLQDLWFVCLEILLVASMERDIVKGSFSIRNVLVEM